ncbi:hypothetical protein AHAS_Ahas19G0146700 [Arachis hypogaea]
MSLDNGENRQRGLYCGYSRGEHEQLQDTGGKGISGRAEVLGNRVRLMHKVAMMSGMSVVVKRMTDMNKMGKDVFDAEMRHKNILGPLAY